MTSTIGVKKIQYPNGTDILTLDSSGTLAIGGNITTDITTTGTVNTPSINGGQIGGRRNLIINGAMAVQQRGTSSVTSGYFVDRFRLSGCSASAVITSNTPTEFPTAITVSATSGNPIVTQRIESKNVQHLSGKVVTASFFAKNVSNATTLYASLQYAGSADNWGSSTTISEQNLGSLTGDWVKYTASWTVPAGGLNGLALNILCAGSSTFTMGVTGVQLEVGSQATPFEHRSFAEELTLCQRYFYRWKTDGEAYSNLCIGGLYWHNLARGVADIPQVMRSNPSLTSSGTFRIVSMGSGAVGTSITVSMSRGHTSHPYVQFTRSGGSSLTGGQTAEMGANNDTDAVIDFSSEL